MVNLGKIEKLDVREVWSREDQDFTPWLAENLDLLNDELGLNLELDDTEVPVGGFSLDILSRDVNSNAVVAIENQIAGTDHSHLGQLLTYAAGTEASIVIWVATDFRAEHQAALDWLNQHTDEDTGFFGVEISAIRIGESLPAPALRTISAPKFWSKSESTTQNSQLTDIQKQLVQFWRPLLEKINTHSWNVKTENRSREFSVGSGFSLIWLRMRMPKAGEARVELYIDRDKEWNKAVFDGLEESKSDIEDELQIKLIWERLNNNKASRVSVSRSGSIEDTEEQLDEIRQWMIENVLKFRSIFRSYLEGILNRMGAD